MYMEHNANTVNESQKTIFISFASNIVNVNDIAQIANNVARLIRLNYLIIISGQWRNRTTFSSVRMRSNQVN